MSPPPRACPYTLDPANHHPSVLLGTFVLIDKIEPFHQPFSLDNYTLFYPFAEHERVTVTMAALIAIAFPMLVIIFYTMVIDGIFSHQTAMPTARGGLKRLTGRYRFKDRLWELNCGLLGLFLSVCFAFTITGMQVQTQLEHCADGAYRSTQECDWQAAAGYHQSM